MRFKITVLAGLLALLFTLSLHAQTFQVSANFSQAPDPAKADFYIVGGTLVLTFQDTVYTESGIALNLVPSDTLLRFSLSRPPVAYKNKDPRQAIPAIPFGDHITVSLPPYSNWQAGDSITIVAPVFDVLGLSTDALLGQQVKLSLYSTSPGVTFLQQEVIIARVAGRVAPRTDLERLGARLDR